MGCCGPTKLIAKSLFGSKTSLSRKSPRPAFHFVIVQLHASGHHNSYLFLGNFKQFLPITPYFLMIRHVLGDQQALESMEGKGMK
jgi:hypothetical protein